MCTEQTGREARGQAAAFCLEPLTFGAKCVFQRQVVISATACNFSGVGVILFLTDKGG